MNRELIVDAMEFIDQDIIEETDALRCISGQMKKKKKMVLFKKSDIVVAGVAVAAVFFIMIGIAMFNPLGGYKDSGAPEWYKGDVYGDNAVQDEGEPIKEPIMLIRVDKWLDDGFEGTVMSDESQYGVPKGDSIKVKFDSDTKIDITGYENFKYSGANAKDCHITTGTVVTVNYEELMEDDKAPGSHGSTGSATGSTGDENAGHITHSLKAKNIKSEERYSR